MKNWRLLGDAPKRNPHDENYLMYENIKTKEIKYIKENIMNKIVIDITNVITKEIKRYILLNTEVEEIQEIVIEQCEILGWEEIVYSIINLEPDVVHEIINMRGGE
jgi:hypothetical protein